MATYRVREGRRGDVTRVWPATIETAWSDLPAEERASLPREEFEEHFRKYAEPFLTSRHNTLLVAEDERGRLAGYLLVGPYRSAMRPVTFGFVFDLWVDPSCRRQGVATLLLRRAEDWCRSQGLQRLKLETAAANAAARALYAKLGFRDERVHMGKAIG